MSLQKILVAGISAEGEQILHRYIDKYMPDAEIEALKVVGLKGQLKRRASSPSAALVIVEDSLWQQCIDDCADVLNLSKVHHYFDDTDLVEFLNSKFNIPGGADDFTSESSQGSPQQANAGVSSDGLDRTPVINIPNPEDEFIQRQMQAQSQQVAIQNSVGVQQTAPVIQQTIPAVQQSQQVNPAVQQNIQVNSQVQQNIPQVQVQSSQPVVSASNITSQINSQIDYEEVSRLKAQLSQAEITIRSLSAQVQENNSDEKMVMFANRIRELSETITQKDNEIAALRQNSGGANADRAIRELSIVKNDLNASKRAFSDLSVEKEKLQNELVVLEKRVKDIDNEKITLEEDKRSLEQDILDLQERINVLNSENETLKASNSDYSSKLAEIPLLQGKIDELSSVSAILEETKKALEEKQLEYENLVVDSRGIKAESENLKNKIDELNIRIDNKNADIDKLTTEYNSLAESLANKESEVHNLQQEINTKDNDLTSTTNALNSEKARAEALTEHLKNLKEEVDTLTAQITDLKTNLSVKDAKIQELAITNNDEISAMQQELAQLSIKDNEIAELRSTILNLESQITELSDKCENYKLGEQASTETLESKERAYNMLLEEKNRLEAGIASIREEKDNIANKYNSLLNENEQNNSETQTQYNALSVELENLRSENEKLTNTITKLQGDNTNLNNDRVKLIQIENDLLEERRINANLMQENENLKASDKSAQVIELQSELSSAKRELREVKRSAISPEDFQKKQQELDASIENYNKLQEEYFSMNNMLNEYDESIFNKFGEIAMPKNGMSLELPLNNKRVYSNIYCIACGSTESNDSLYSIITRSFMMDKQRRYLIVDLASESTIDRDLEVKGIVSPIQWLTGADRISNYLRPTKFNNVHVATFSTSYINDLYYFNVDWSKKFDELCQYANIIIFNIGCINNLTSKVLFNTFSSCMHTYVITKASPLSVRSLSINVTSFVNMRKSVDLVCYDINSNASKDMLSRMSQRYNIKTLGNNSYIPF